MSLTHPYEKDSFARQRAITEATKPASRAVQSKNIWKESEMRPRLKKEIKKLNGTF